MRHRHISIVLGLGCVFVGADRLAAATMTAVDTAAVLDFAGYRGIGCATVVTNGELNSNDFAIEGLVSDSDSSPLALAFGGSVGSNTPLSRGKSAGGVSSGIYAADLGGTDRGLGMQPTATILTPGTITARFQNNTGVAIGSFDLSYEIWVYNDKAESSGLNFAWSTNYPTDFVAVPALDYTTPKTAATGTVAYALSATKTATLTATVAPGDYFYLQFQSFDPATSTGGSRDELARDDISLTPHALAITAVPEPTSALFLLAAAPLTLLRRRRA
jgi:hypothetical protein